MKRVVEKVKDIVEVRPFTHLSDFSADPVLTLAGYHFTDITADLMGKWITRIAGVSPGQGAAQALAGFRGVGKSHFLAVVAAIVSKPELRSKINDTYVAQCSDRLPRRHGSVAFVRRGLGTSLVDELKRAVAELLGSNPGTLSDSLYDLLLKASEHSGDSPLAVLIDTAQGRETRVARDDGRIISEIAEAADTLGIFVGVALDDDISGADGPNSSISVDFSIDYLDQEHLYRIVEAHIFSKNSQQLPLLKEIYGYYRQVMPGFRWSEQRFTSLYPLHPAAVEIAPLIRLYIQDFALLRFASEAGVKILGRPANSLIGLDEVYDSVETKLRAVPDLQEAFSFFDTIEQQVVAKLPVQQRLPAKLVLKGLLMLSLDGQGTTADELAASMMIFSDAGSGTAQIDVRQFLDAIVETMEGAVERKDLGDGSAKYLIGLAAKRDTNDKLTTAAQAVGDEAVWQTLVRQSVDKFSDVEQSAVDGSQPTVCSIEWRGGIRRGLVKWSRTSEVLDARLFDWSLQLKWAGEPATTGSGEVVWEVADLSKDERDTVCRYHSLQTDPDVRHTFGEGLPTALHLHGIAVEKVWQRVFLRDAKVVVAGSEVTLADAAGSSHSLSQLLTPILAPVFEELYPAHPQFAHSLGQKEVSSLVSGFFGGAENNQAEAQKLAEVFAFPLGIACKNGEVYVPSPPEILHELPVVRAAFDQLDLESEGVISLEDLASRMQASPTGLTRETQHLVLTALVAQREFEFVTSSGNRINHRSLDLQVIWDDIVGIARPDNESFPVARLLVWAKLTTGNSGLRSLDRDEDKSLVLDSLSAWLAAWVESRILADFEALPDENLNAEIWKTAANLRKTFGEMANAIDSLCKEQITLDKCLRQIAEIFSDSEEEFERKKSEMRVLGNFTNSVSRRGTIAAYLAVCEFTDDAEIESARNLLLEAIDANSFWSSARDVSRIEELWANFQSAYTAYYSARHDAAVGNDSADEGLRNVLVSREWWAFEALYGIPWADQRFLLRARAVIREIRQRRCAAPVAEILANQPFCTCSFSLTTDDPSVDPSDQLRSIVYQGLSAIKRQLEANSRALIEATDSDAIQTALQQALKLLSSSDGIASLSSQDLRLLWQAANRAAEGVTGGFVVDADTDESEISEHLDLEIPKWESTSIPSEVIASP